MYERGLGLAAAAMQALVAISVLSAGACAGDSCDCGGASGSGASPAPHASSSAFPPIGPGAGKSASPTLPPIPPPSSTPALPPIGSPSGSQALAPGGLFTERRQGTYSGLPINVPEGDLEVSYTLGPGCTSVVATLGAELLRQSNPGTQPLTDRTLQQGGGFAGNHALHVDAPPGCAWTIAVAKKP